MMNMCLGFDHRATDGAQAGKFIGDVKRWLESVDAEHADLVDSMARAARCSSPPARPATATARPSRSPSPWAAAASTRRGRRLHRAAPPPRLDQGAPAHRRQLPRAQGHPARPDAQHRLRGGPLPQHRRVLGAAHGHDHDPGRHLHPRLRLLRRQDRPADLERRGRAAPRGRGDRARWASSTWSSPASPATTCPTAARTSSPRPSAPCGASARAWASRC